MPDQRTPDEAPRDICEAERQTDNVILGFMLREGWPWSADEVRREYGDRLAATDSIRRLIDHGLVHRLGNFVFPTRTARRAAEIEIGT